MRTDSVPPITYMVDEVADLLKVSRGLIDCAVMKGKIGHIRVGRSIRILQDQLDRYLFGLKEGGKRTKTGRGVSTPTTARRRYPHERAPT